jgi:hypothetical protein
MRCPERVWLLPVVWLLIVAFGKAQNTATILGAVSDQSGAVLPGAEVTATHVESGHARTTVTGPAGSYRLPSLAVGSYDVTITKAGFRSIVRQGITLTIGREAVVDFTMALGSTTSRSPSLEKRT